MELRLLTYLVALSVGPVLCTALPSVAAAGIPVQRIKVPYGPFFVPGVNEEPSRGMQEFRLQSVQSPCPGASASPAVGCLVLSARAGIQFDSDGTVANANKGMWLHHVVISNNGRKDPVCDKWPERWFASGNERTLVDYTGNGYVRSPSPCDEWPWIELTAWMPTTVPSRRATSSLRPTACR